MSEAKPKASKRKDSEVSTSNSSVQEDVGIPGEEDLRVKTDDEGIHLDDVGSNTGRLSDITDDDDLMLRTTTTKHSFSSWYKQQVKPLVKNRRVRCFSLMNLLLFILNICLLIALLVLVIILVVIMAENFAYEGYSKPCLYEWNDWGECSAECREPNGDPPIRNRTIDKKTVVHARGDYLKTAPCPKDLENLVDYAPCNTHLCPRNLSTFNFTKPLRAGEQGCYRIREIPRMDAQIRIDTDTLYEEGVDCQEGNSPKP